MANFTKKKKHIGKKKIRNIFYFIIVVLIYTKYITIYFSIFIERAYFQIY